MKSLSCLLAIVSLSFLVHRPLQGSKSVGEIVEIGCKAEFKTGVSGEEHPLDSKRDRGRKVQIGERYRCTDKGQLKLKINDQEVVITPEIGWYPIPEPSEGSDSPTGGRTGDLSWLTGTYTLDSVQSVSGRAMVDQFVDTLNYSNQGSFRTAMNAQLEIPKELAFSYHEQFGLVKFKAAGPVVLGFRADNVLYTSKLSDGTMSRFKASSSFNKLFIDWYLGEMVRSDLTVESKNDGKTLLVTRRMFVSGNPNPFTTTIAYRRESESAPQRSQLLNAVSLFPQEITIVAELAETIDTKGFANFVLNVKEPSRYFGSTLEGYSLSLPNSNGEPGQMLTLHVQRIRFRNGTEHFIQQALVERVMVQGGPELTFVPDYSRLTDKQVGGLKGPVQSSVMTASKTQLGREISIPKGSRFQLKATIP